MKGKTSVLRLASKSPARRAMLEAAGVPFRLIDADLDEDEVKKALRADGLGPAQLSLALAEAKAAAARGKEEDLVLGCDQVLEREDGTMPDKPKSPADALEQLRSLSGRTHRLHSSAAIVEDGRPVWRATESVSLTMRPVAARFLAAYLEREYEAIRWSVGGYRIEGLGAQLFEQIEGSHFAILGLPLLPLLAYLRERGVLES